MSEPIKTEKETPNDVDNAFVAFWKRLWKKFKKTTKDYFHPEGVQKEILRYRPNSVSFNFGVLGLVFYAFGQAFLYTSSSLRAIDGFRIMGILISPGVMAGLDIVINILLMLFLFLSAARMKTYSIRWGVFSVCAGVFQIIRVFVYIMPLRVADLFPTVDFTHCVIGYILSGACLVIGGLLSVYRGTALHNYLKTVKPIENDFGGTK